MTAEDLRRAEIADFLALRPTAIAVLTERLRVLVKQAVPGAVERLRPGWHLIGYDLPIKGTGTYFAWVFPEIEHVHVGWQTGTLMNDPEHLLRGAEENLKKARYLTFEPGDRIWAGIVLDFTRDAARIASMPRGERQLLALLRDHPDSPR
jgi:hypothetical protein